MHAFFITRGNKREVDELVKFLETRLFYMPYTDTDGSKKKVPLQGNLQPIQLWSYVFPREYKDAVLTALKFSEKTKRWIDNPKKRAEIEALRLALGADKVPDFEYDPSILLPQEALNNTAIMPIGVHYDDPEWKDPYGKIHEAL